MKDRKKIYVIFTLIIISLGIAFLAVYFTKVYELTYVTDAEYSDGQVYGVESTDSNYFVFQYDIESQQGEGINVPFVTGTVAETISGPYLIEGQGAYVYRVVKNVENLADSSNNYHSIAYCDFENGELDDVVYWSDDEEFFYQVTSMDEKLYFIMYSTDGMLRYYEFDGETLEYYGEIEYKTGTALRIIDRYLNLWSYTYEGDIYCQTIDGTDELVFENNGIEITRENSNYIGGKGVYFTNLDDETVYELTYIDGVFSMQEFVYDYSLLAYEINQYNVQNYNEKDDVYLSLVEIDDRVIISLITEDDEMVIDSITKNRKVLCTQRIQIFFVVFLLLIFIWLMGRKYKKDGTGIPVFILILCLLIPMNIFGCYYSILLMQENLKEQIMMQTAEQLSNIADVYINEIDIEVFEENSQQDYVTESDLYEQFSEFFSENEFYDATSETYESFNSILCVNLYYLKEEELYSASLTNILNVSLNANDNLAGTDEIITALSENMDVILEYRMYGIDVLSVVKPVTNSSGEVIGGIEIVLDYDVTFENFEIYKSKIAAVYIACSILFTIIVTVIVYLGTRGLRKTRNAAKEIIQGNMSVRIHSKANNEIGELNRSIDSMVEELETKTIYMKNQEEKYEAMMDSALFEMINKEGVLVSKEGENTQVNTLVATIGFEQKGSFSFQKFNEEISELIEYISERKLGVIQVQKENLKITVLDNNQVIDVVICLQELLKSRNDERYISIIRQTSKIGIVGMKDCKELVTISLDEEFRVIMQEFVKRYQTPIVISGEAAAHVKNIFEGYQIRTLGYVKVGYAHKLEVIYEVLDGNKQQDLRLKLDTKEIFEEGVKLYMSGKLEQSMKKFIQVLMRNPNDLVAQEYILLCEERLKNNEIQEFYFIKCD